MLPAPHQKPYTLLLSIDDLLVTSTWGVSSFVTTVILNPPPLFNHTNNFLKRQHGWRTAKRSGVDYFLAYLPIL
jgi:import inner membrane translocase subunit TIM50